MVTAHTPLVQRIEVERAAARERQLDLARIVLTALALVFYVPVWLLARVLALAWRALAWAGTTMRLAWHDGFTPHRP